MGKMQREKGASFERKIANFFKDYGYDAHRSAQFCGKTGQAADVIGVPGLHLECKHVEAMRLYEWMEQAVNDATAAGEGIPTVIHKKNHADILVTMRLEDWIELYREWESGQYIKEKETS